MTSLEIIDNDLACPTFTHVPARRVSGLHQATHCTFPSFLCLTVTTWCASRPLINVLVFSWLILISATSTLELNSSSPHKNQSMVSTRSSTRIKQSASPERPFSQSSQSSYTVRKDDLPPPMSKEERGTRSHVQKPLEQIRLATFLHILLCALLVCLAWYAYRTTVVALDTFTFTSPNAFSDISFVSLHSNPLWQFFSRHFRWGGSGPGHDGHSGLTQLDVERRIEELADTLGVDPVEFARAIADAVRQLVPPASLSLLANEATETGGGRIMDVLMGKYAHG